MDHCLPAEGGRPRHPAPDELFQAFGKRRRHPAAKASGIAFLDGIVEPFCFLGCLGRLHSSGRECAWDRGTARIYLTILSLLASAVCGRGDSLSWILGGQLLLARGAAGRGECKLSSIAVIEYLDSSHHQHLC